MGSSCRSPERVSAFLSEHVAPRRRWRLLRQRTRPLLIGELLIIVALVVVYDRLRSLAEVRVPFAVEHGWAILHDEMSLHLRIEDGLNTWLAGQALLRELCADYYQFMHETVALSVLAICYVKRPKVYRPARNAIVLTNVIGSWSTRSTRSHRHGCCPAPGSSTSSLEPATGPATARSPRTSTARCRRCTWPGRPGPR